LVDVVVVIGYQTWKYFNDEVGESEIRLLLLLSLLIIIISGVFVVLLYQS
jgi:hypothetical protein